MATKSKEITAASITGMYIHYCLENNEKPKSVYLFCKKNGIPEKDFYAYFSSVEAIEKSVFVNFHRMAIELINKSADSETLGFRDKLLTYYYTFFEILTANRSYVVFALKGDRSKVSGLLQLNALRSDFKQFIGEISQGYLKAQSERVYKVKQATLEEGAWIQLIATAKFWLDDESVAFEKTDLFIEKSIRATFDLIDITPLESVLDFGRFLIKEKLR